MDRVTVRASQNRAAPTKNTEAKAPLSALPAVTGFKRARQQRITYDRSRPPRGPDRAGRNLRQKRIESDTLLEGASSPVAATADDYLDTLRARIPHS